MVARRAEERFFFIDVQYSVAEPLRPVRFGFYLEATMDSTTLLIILIVIVLLGGGGYYGRGRWF